MRIHIETTAGRRAVVAHCPEHAVAEGACPSCKAEPFKAAGVEGTMRHDRDTYTADARYVACTATVGDLVVTMDTLFGIDEDEAVLHGRARVY